MKEKLKNLYNNKKTKILIKILIGLFIINEMYNIYVDIYNFRQLEKVKEIINNDNNFDVSFQNLRDFNYIYKPNIKPIKKCYYISKYNGKEKYIFGFKLESIIYRLIYFGKNYSYPRYNLPVLYICPGNGKCNYDGNKGTFEYTISNPCQD